MIRIILTTISILLVNLLTYAQQEDFAEEKEVEEANNLLIDQRDNQVYRIVKIGEQIWMAENLRAIIYSDGLKLNPNIDTYKKDSINDELIELKIDSEKTYSWYDDDSLSNARKYGALYSFEAATNGQIYDGKTNIQGVCPSGWHIPNLDEWYNLIEFISKDKQISEGQEGVYLKAKDGWYREGNGIDDYGFNASPGGRRVKNGDFEYLGKYGEWWSCIKSKSGQKYYRVLNYEYDTMSLFYDSDDIAISVRCIKD